MPGTQHFGTFSKKAYYDVNDLSVTASTHTSKYIRTYIYIYMYVYIFLLSKSYGHAYQSDYMTVTFNHER